MIHGVRMTSVVGFRDRNNKRCRLFPIIIPYPTATSATG